MRRFAWVFLICVTACAPSATLATFSSPYQRALDGYYDALAGRISLEDGVALVEAALADAPGDQEARLVAAQLHLRRYAVSGDADARASAVRALLTVAAGLRAAEGSSDWVEPRLYVTFADLLMHDAARAQNDRSDPVKARWTALITYDAARRFYVFAHGLAATGSSHALGLELGHAERGFLESNLGLVATVLDLKENFPVLDARHDEALGHLEAVFTGTSLRERVEGEDVNVPPTVTMTLEPELHQMAAATFLALAAASFADLEARCGQARRDADPDEAWALWRKHLEDAAYHGLVTEALGAQSNLDLALSFLNDPAMHHVGEACALVVPVNG